MFPRIAINYLNQWYVKTNRKPLIIRGARQVGKTELVRMFAQRQQLALLEVNLEIVKIEEFSRKEFSVHRCLNEIMALKGCKSLDRVLLFIDEIQESPEAYSRLRYFLEEIPQLPVMVAGSLLEPMLKQEQPKIPVGRVEYLFLGTFTFYEYLMACNEQSLIDYLKNCLNLALPISESIHEKALKLFRDYLFVGGMPEVIREFLNSNQNYLIARDVQQHILNAFSEDIRRYAHGKTALTVEEVLHHLPNEIGKKVVFSRLSNTKSTYTKDAVDLLESVFLIQKVFHSNGTSIPLNTTVDLNLFKMYFLDVGLLGCLMQTNWSEYSNYVELFSKGELSEQFVAQQLYLKSLQIQRPQTYYHLRDKQINKAEIDFLIDYNHNVCPIEVKAGQTGKLKSLYTFMGENPKLKQAIRLDTAYRTHRIEKVHSVLKYMDRICDVDFLLQNLPVYLINFIVEPQLLDKTLDV